MSKVIFSILFIFAFQCNADEQCKEMNISGVNFSTSLDRVVKEFGPFRKKEYFRDIETKGQYSGWSLSKDGLDVFVADLGGFTYANITGPVYIVSSQYKVGNQYPEANGRKEIEIFPCLEPSITEQKITLKLNSIGTIQSIKVEEYGL